MRAKLATPVKRVMHALYSLSDFEGCSSLLLLSSAVSSSRSSLLRFFSSLAGQHFFIALAS